MVDSTGVLDRLAGRSQVTASMERVPAARTGAAVLLIVPFGPGWPASVLRYIPARPTSVATAVRSAFGGESQ